MTVKELIEALNKMPLHLEVVFIEEESSLSNPLTSVMHVISSKSYVPERVELWP